VSGTATAMAEEEDTTWTTSRQGSSRRQPPSFWENDVSSRWFQVTSPLLIALTTLGNPLAVITLQSPLSTACLARDHRD